MLYWIGQTKEVQPTQVNKQVLCVQGCGSVLVKVLKTIEETVLRECAFVPEATHNIISTKSCGKWI